MCKSSDQTVNQLTGRISHDWDGERPVCGLRRIRLSTGPDKQSQKQGKPKTQTKTKKKEKKTKKTKKKKKKKKKKTKPKHKRPGTHKKTHTKKKKTKKKKTQKKKKKNQAVARSVMRKRERGYCLGGGGEPLKVLRRDKGLGAGGLQLEAED